MRLILIVCLLGLLAQTANGAPSICITFDEPLLDWKSDFIASDGIFLKNFGVEIQKNCGLFGDCGVFQIHSKIEIPFFKNTDFFDFSISVWFKRRGRFGCMPIVISSGDHQHATVQISSLDDNTLAVTVRAATPSVYAQTFTTDSQSDDWRHVVVTVRVDKLSDWGWAKVYIDGFKRGQGYLDARLAIRFPIFVGSKSSDVCDVQFFSGFMDSLSFARYALTVREVRALYQSRGQCISD